MAPICTCDLLVLGFKSNRLNQLVYQSECDDSPSWFYRRWLAVRFLRLLPAQKVVRMGSRRDGIPLGSLVEQASFGSKCTKSLSCNSVWITLQFVMKAGRYCDNLLSLLCCSQRDADNPSFRFTLERLWSPSPELSFLPNSISYCRGWRCLFWNEPIRSAPTPRGPPSPSSPPQKCAAK